MAERCRAINPAIEVDPVASFLTPTNLDELLDRGYDLVLDACDSFRSKVVAIAWCRRRKQPIVTVGSAGGRTDPTQVRVRDLSRTEHDAMLSLIRKKLRGEFNFPKNADRYFGVPAVYSLENVQLSAGRRQRVRRASAAGQGRRAQARLRRGAWRGDARHRRVRVRGGRQGAGNPAAASRKRDAAALRSRCVAGANSRSALRVVAAASSAGSSSRSRAIVSSTVASRAGSLRCPRMPASGWSGASVSSSRHSSGIVAASLRSRLARS